MFVFVPSLFRRKTFVFKTFICQTRKDFDLSNGLNPGGVVDIPWDDGVFVVREAVLGAGDVDGVHFIIFEREVQDALRKEGVVERSAVGGDHGDAAEGGFDGIVCTCEVEEEAWGVLVAFHRWAWMAVGCERKVRMTLTRKHLL